MKIVTVSSKFQIVIPQEIRESLNLRAGQRLAVYELGSSIRIEPLRSVKALRGIAKGIRWEETDRDHSVRS